MSITLQILLGKRLSVVINFMALYKTNSKTQFCYKIFFPYRKSILVQVLYPTQTMSIEFKKKIFKNLNTNGHWITVTTFDAVILLQIKNTKYEGRTEIRRPTVFFLAALTFLFKVKLDRLNCITYQWPIFLCVLFLIKITFY